jgi:hypothetical protein
VAGSGLEATEEIGADVEGNGTQGERTPPLWQDRREREDVYPRCDKGWTLGRGGRGLRTSVMLATLLAAPTLPVCRRRIF